MEAEPKKLSFGFKKVIKSQPKHEERKQFIDCLEGKSIKVKGGEIVEEKKPLIIPLKPNDKSAALLRIAKEVEAGISDDPNNKDSNGDVQRVIPENESLEAKAARELLEEATKMKKVKTESGDSMVVPLAQNVDLRGEKESTMDDYENIPIAEFGMAMLRGMGWTPGKGMGKHNPVDLQLPSLRPKGMGLGADKISIQPPNGTQGNNNKNEEELKIIKGSFVKFVNGKRNGTYGQVNGFDEDSGRIIIKAALTGEIITANEFMVVAVSKSEYQKCSKVINIAKYTEYREKEQTNPDRMRVQITESQQSSRIDSHKSKHEPTDKYSSGRDDRRHMEDRERKHRKYSESDSDSSSQERSRDKKKGKKKKRDRSRSREHRRHH